MSNIGRGSRRPISQREGVIETSIIPISLSNPPKRKAGGPCRGVCPPSARVVCTWHTWGGAAGRSVSMVLWQGQAFNHSTVAGGCLGVVSPYAALQQLRSYSLGAHLEHALPDLNDGKRRTHHPWRKSRDECRQVSRAAFTAADGSARRVRSHLGNPVPFRLARIAAADLKRLYDGLQLLRLVLHKLPQVGKPGLTRHKIRVGLKPGAVAD
eukprot:scaffold5876_cov129-Isochrysis_galbana.AAC.6